MSDIMQAYESNSNPTHQQTVEAYVSRDTIYNCNFVDVYNFSMKKLNYTNESIERYESEANPASQAKADLIKNKIADLSNTLNLQDFYSNLNLSELACLGW